MWIQNDYGEKFNQHCFFPSRAATDSGGPLDVNMNCMSTDSLESERISYPRRLEEGESCFSKWVPGYSDEGTTTCERLATWFFEAWIHYPSLLAPSCVPGFPRLVSVRFHR